MRIAFLWLNTRSPVGMSYGVLILARELQDAGHQVRIFHLNQEVGLSSEPETVMPELLRFAPALVALSFGSPHAVEARRLAAAIAKSLPDSYTLAGGIHATLCPEEVFRWAGIDAIGIGELDGGPLVDFVGRLSAGSGHQSVGGFWVHHQGGDRLNPLAPLPRIDRQALPLYEAIDLEGLVRAKRGFGEVMASRGCPHRCRFCQNQAVVERYRSSLEGPPHRWPYCRLRSLDNLLAELKLMRQRAPSLTAFMFADDRLPFDQAWLADFTDRYRSEIGLPFIVNATADQIDPRTADYLERAGCNLVKLGVECAPGRIQREVLGRPFGRKATERAFSLLKQHGMNTMAYLMIGIPTETKEDVLATHRFCAALRPDAVRVSMFCPFPGTQIHRDLVQQGLIGETGGGYGFLKRSVLDWPDEMQLVLEKTLTIHPWLLNGNLEEPVGPQSAALTDWVWSASRAAWESRSFRDELASRSRLLLERFEDQGRSHYHSPFPERPDYSFLKTRRKRPLLNVDQPPVEPGASSGWSSIP